MNRDDIRSVGIRLDRRFAQSSLAINGGRAAGVAADAGASQQLGARSVCDLAHCVGQVSGAVPTADVCWARGWSKPVASNGAQLYTIVEEFTRPIRQAPICGSTAAYQFVAHSFSSLLWAACCGRLVLRIRCAALEMDLGMAERIAHGRGPLNRSSMGASSMRSSTHKQRRHSSSIRLLLFHQRNGTWRFSASFGLFCFGPLDCQTALMMRRSKRSWRTRSSMCGVATI